MLVSTVVTAAEITADLGIEPDRIRVRGSRRPDPPLPTLHMWEVVSNSPGLRVDEHIGVLVTHLQEHSASIGAMARRIQERDPTPSVGSVLRVVRHLGDEEDGEEEDEGLIELPTGERLERLRPRPHPVRNRCRTTSRSPARSLTRERRDTSRSRRHRMRGSFCSATTCCGEPSTTGRPGRPPCHRASRSSSPSSSPSRMGRSSSEHRTGSGLRLADDTGSWLQGARSLTDHMAREDEAPATVEQP